MNDFGIFLAWLAIQVTLVLIPALILNSLALRRQPQAAAWVATWSLGAVVILGGLSLVPGFDSLPGLSDGSIPNTNQQIQTKDPTDIRDGTGLVNVPNDSAGSHSSARWSIDGLRERLQRLQVQAVEPAERFRPWGRTLAILALIGSGFGLIRLGLGLWAVAHCRRRGQIIDDPALVELVVELSEAMGCHRKIELREMADLATPATAGWLRPMILLPDDWRGWDASERRAVIAHELAHIIRADYASGLVARVAVVLHAWHPLVRWMAGRLALQQELAADALGAEFAGGRSSYLLALSQLALKQDGRSPSWPARAFLPTRGTLIRRIKMLRIENPKTFSSMNFSRSKRLATALVLVGLTWGAASLKQPARAADDKPAPVPSQATTKAPAVEVEPFAVEYIPDGMPGVIGLRPAALARRIGVEKTNAMIERVIGGDLLMLAKRLGLDMSRPGFIKLGIEDIESITFGFKFGYQTNGPKNENGENLQTIEFSTFTIKTIDAFDWPKFFRQWTMPLDEIREPKGVYYKPSNAGSAELLMGAAFFQPDRRTLIFEYEPRIKTLIANGAPPKPEYLRGADWDRVSRKLVAVAINNQAGVFAKGFDPNREDDKEILPFFNGVESCFVGVPDDDRLSFQISGACPKPENREMIIKAFTNNFKELREQFKQLGVGQIVWNLDPTLRVYKNVIEKVRIVERNGSLEIVAEDFGKFAELPSILNTVLEHAVVVEDEDVKASKPETKPIKP
jgi:hypothetical protein